MNKSRILRILVLVAILAVVVAAMSQFDLLGALKRLHGMA